MRPLAKKAPKPKPTPPAANLNAAIARLRTNAKDLVAESKLAQKSPEARLDAILREIDETVLPREIVLHADAAVLATLTVSNRRLCTVDLTDQKGVNGTAPSFAFAKSLHAVSARVTHMSTATNTKSTSTDTQTHCSVAQLRKGLVCVTEPASMDDLQAHLARDAVAQMAWQNGADAEFSGAAPWRSFLDQMVQEFGTVLTTMNENATKAGKSPKNCVIPVSEEHIAILAGTTQNGFAVIAEHSQGFETIQRWQARDLADL